MPATYYYSSSLSYPWLPPDSQPLTCGGLYYVVPGMRLIPQDKTMSCWFASAQMIIEWRRWSGKGGLALFRADPSQIAEWKKLYTDNAGMSNSKILAFARDLSLGTIPPMSPSVGALKGWLMRYGPLWVNGVRHITVIAGIRDWMGEVQVLVFDPARPQNTSGDWRSLSLWYAGDIWSGRDSSAGVQTVFLYAP